MSLVNDMLKDLDQREDNPWPTVSATDQIPEPRPWLNYGLLMLACLVVASAAWWLLPVTNSTPSDDETFLTDQAPSSLNSRPLVSAALPRRLPASLPSNNEISNTETAVSDNRSAEAADVTMTQVVLTDDHRTEIENTENMSLAGENTEKQTSTTVRQAPSQTSAPVAEVSLSRLLAEADRALAEDRLTVPFNNNAFDRYQTALLLSPDNSQALAGITAVAHRYVALAESAQAEGNSKQAQDFYALAQQVASQVSGLQLPPLSPAPVTAQVAASEPVATTTGQGMSQAEAVADEGVTLVAEPKPQAEGSAGHFQVTTSPEAEDQRIAGEARQLLNAGRFQSAQQRLQEYLASHPNAPHSNDQLFNVYLARGDYQAAEQLLVAMTHLNTAEQHMRRARLLVQQNQLAQAVELLTDDAPPIHEAREYHSLLAGIYLKQRRFDVAANLYNQLVLLDENQGQYRLGYALALDGQGSERAVWAFRQAQRYAAGNAQTQDYIAQRIAALTQ